MSLFKIIKNTFELNAFQPKILRIWVWFVKYFFIRADVELHFRQGFKVTRLQRAEQSCLIPIVWHLRLRYLPKLTMTCDSFLLLVTIQAKHTLALPILCLSHTQKHYLSLTHTHWLYLSYTRTRMHAWRLSLSCCDLSSHSYLLLVQLKSCSRQRSLVETRLSTKINSYQKYLPLNAHVHD